MRVRVFLVGLLLSFWSPPAADAAIFGTAEFRAGSLAALPQWRRVLAAIEKERAVYARCARSREECPSRALYAWQSLLRGLEGEPIEEQIREVNRFVNQWRYRTDRRNYGRSDYWASPLEFFARSGDCEDYAIAKYVSLRTLGVPAEQLRLVVLQDTLRRIPHAVLAVYVDNDIYILDNQTNAILTDRRISHYRPYYSVNENARWAHVAAGTPLVSLKLPQVRPAR